MKRKEENKNMKRDKRKEKKKLKEMKSERSKTKKEKKNCKNKENNSLIVILTKKKINICKTLIDYCQELKPENAAKQLEKR